MQYLISHDITYTHSIFNEIELFQVSGETHVNLKIPHDSLCTPSPLMVIV
jgi:hypothetical protein